MSSTSSNTGEFTYNELMEQYVKATRLIEHLKSQRNRSKRAFDKAMDLVLKYDARIAELEADKERLNSCESALISMVNQFFYSKAGENIFRHSFISAEEEAAEYLVEHGIARWVGKNKSAICFNEAQK